MGTKWNRLPALALLLACVCAFSTGAAELVYLDTHGVIRWKADDREVSLFGANYCLASSCDYRAVGYVHADRKQLVERDMTHFARMGWDSVRLCLWGDWENSDRLGNLIVNDHLDVMDYAIFQARKRGIYTMFTPITTYSAWWPDGKATDDYPGFSKFYDRGQLGVNPAAILAQSNYLWQIFQHVNPYTGVALKDEPSILFVEMINEPVHRSRDVPAATAYINTLADAVRATGCQKLLFHNLSQDFGILPAIRASRAQGVTLGWYPTGLNRGHTLEGNYLRTVDDYAPLRRPEAPDLPKLVYEFDSADMRSGYMYPAMARAFRGVGVQFMAMFSYDMLDTAPYNLGWQTHFLNLVYSPRKALSAIIAAEVARQIPRYSEFGDYPDNRHFGPFRVSYEQDSSEMVTDEKFFYANDTHTVPPNPGSLQHIAGLGSSPVVDYDGCGIYFLDRVASGTWRLELYPDAVIVQDPFAQYLNYRTVCSRLIARERSITIRLPDLGAAFSVVGLDHGNNLVAVAKAGRFSVKPGVFLLSRDKSPDPAGLPQRVGRIGLREFVSPEPPRLPPQILPVVQATYPRDQAIVIAADVLDSVAPQSVTVYARGGGSGKHWAFPLAPQRGFRYETALAPATFSGDVLEFYFTARTADGEVRFPPAGEPDRTARLISPNAPVALFEAGADFRQLAFTRIGDGVRHGIFQRREASGDEPEALRLFFPLSYDASLNDYTASMPVKRRVWDRKPSVTNARNLRVKARGELPQQPICVTLVEADGTSWSQALVLCTNWQEHLLPLAGFKVSRGVKLPLGFPGRWNYWLTPAKGRGSAGDRLRVEAIEHLQISFRPEPGVPKSKNDYWADIASADLVFE